MNKAILEEKGKTEDYKWQNIGCHFTPDYLAEDFARFVFLHYKKYYINYTKKLSILDLFAGDGILGNKTAKKLLTYVDSVKTTFIEINSSSKMNTYLHFSKNTIINLNAFNWAPQKQFDIVVSNPPYLILNKQKSKELSIPWPNVKKYTRNLYGLGIIKGLELCREDGFLSVIAPFNWLRGIYCESFRKEIKSLCSEVLIHAFKNRDAFKGINQDIGFQLFKKRKKKDSRKTYFKFKFNGSDRQQHLRINKISNIKQNELIHRVRVGPIVWNREKEKLTHRKQNSFPLIYGGNIRPNGILKLNFSKYAKKQYFKKASIKPDLISKSPLILLRRTLRGSPGNWLIDSCIVTKQFSCVVENHVVVIEILLNDINREEFNQKLIDELSSYYYFSGSPSISVKVVKEIIKKITKKI